MTGGISAAALRAAVREQAKRRERRQLAVAAGAGRAVARAGQLAAAVERARQDAAVAHGDAERALAAASEEFGGPEAASAILNPADPEAVVDAIRAARRRVGAVEARQEADRLASQATRRGRPGRRAAPSSARPERRAAGGSAGAALGELVQPVVPGARSEDLDA